MQLSNYNFLLPNPKYGNYLIYNSLKNSLLEIDEPHIVSLFKNSNDVKQSIKNLSPYEIQTLLEYGILCNSKKEQFDIALTAEKKIKSLDKFGKLLSLTILPTSNCNMRCVYCFEPDNIRKKPMSKKVQDDVVMFVEKNIKEYGVKYVKVEWYGGEPLLCKDIIIDLQYRLNEVCERNGADMKKCDMISNGLLLDKNTSDDLAKIGMKNIQITIDGTEDVHNKRRYYPANPNNNFKRIIENIQNANKIKIGIRINIDKSNKDEAYNFIKYSHNEGLWPHVFHNVYIADVTKSYCREHNTDSLFTKKEFIKFNIDFKIWLVKFYNEITKSNIAKYKFEYPSKFLSGCGYSAHNNAWVISPNGGLYRCWETIGYTKEAAMLSDILKNNIDVRPLAENEFITENIRKTWGCYTCRFFPVCNIHCPYAPKAFEEKRICPEWKFGLQEIMINQYNFYKENPGLVYGFSENISNHVPMLKLK